MMPSPERYRSALPGLILFGLLLSLPIFSAHAGSWLVKVREAAVIPGEYVLLKDIADPLPDLPDQQWKRLGETSLGPSPDPGRVVVLTRDQLAAILDRSLGSVAGSIQIPSSIKVQRGGNIISEGEIHRKVVEKLTPRVADLQGEAQFRDFRLPDSLFLDQGDFKIQVETPGRVSPGRNSVLIVIKDGYGQTVRSVSGSFFLDLWQTVPCAARPLNRREGLQSEDVTFLRKNAAYLRSKVWDGKGGPWQVMRPMGQGQVIYADSLEVLPLVRRGDTVDLIYRGATIRLTVPAKVLADAGAGEPVLVENIQSRKKVQARVIDGGTVAVR